jgi:hypothetical protein
MKDRVVTEVAFWCHRSNDDAAQGAGFCWGALKGKENTCERA